MIPWLQSNFNFPLSGDVSQSIEPDWFFGAIDPEMGDKEIEKEIFLKIASYGKQIGIITDVLISMANELKLDGKNIDGLSKLQSLHAKIESIKKDKKSRIKDNAKSVLDKLQEFDQEAFNNLLKEYGYHR